MQEVPALEVPDRARRMQAAACRQTDPPLPLPLPHTAAQLNSEPQSWHRLAWIWQLHMGCCAGVPAHQAWFPSCSQMPDCLRVCRQQQLQLEGPGVARRLLGLRLQSGQASTAWMAHLRAEDHAWQHPGRMLAPLMSDVSLLSKLDKTCCVASSLMTAGALSVLSAAALRAQVGWQCLAVSGSDLHSKTLLVAVGGCGQHGAARSST